MSGLSVKTEKRQLNKPKASSRLEKLLFVMLSQHQGCDSHREFAADQEGGEEISPRRALHLRPS